MGNLCRKPKQKAKGKISSFNSNNFIGKSKTILMEKDVLIKA